MRRPTLNLLVDAAAFASFVLLTASGILLRYVLPPRSGRFTTLWGWDRHDWGALHFWVAVALMATLAAHLVLHWRWIASTVAGRPREGSGRRVALAVIGALALLALAAAPFLSPIQRVERRGDGRGATSSASEGGSAAR